MNNFSKKILSGLVFSCMIVGFAPSSTYAAGEKTLYDALAKGTAIKPVAQVKTLLPVAQNKGILKSISSYLPKAEFYKSRTFIVSCGVIGAIFATAFIFRKSLSKSYYNFFGGTDLENLNKACQMGCYHWAQRILEKNITKNITIGEKEKLFCAAVSFKGTKKERAELLNFVCEKLFGAREKIRGYKENENDNRFMFDLLTRDMVENAALNSDEEFDYLDWLKSEVIFKKQCGALEYLKFDIDTYINNGEKLAVKYAIKKEKLDTLEKKEELEKLAVRAFNALKKENKEAVQVVLSKCVEVYGGEFYKNIFEFVGLLFTEKPASNDVFYQQFYKVVTSVIAEERNDFLETIYQRFNNLDRSMIFLETVKSKNKDLIALIAKRSLEVENLSMKEDSGKKLCFVLGEKFEPKFVEEIEKELELLTKVPNKKTSNWIKFKKNKNGCEVEETRLIHSIGFELAD